MLMKLKIFFIGLIYFLGGLFMAVFPPKTFPSKTSKILSTAKPRSDEHIAELAIPEYMRSGEVTAALESLALRNGDLATLVPLAPLTSENRTLAALEIRLDEGYRKSGILVVGALDPMVWAAPNAVIELAQELLYSGALHSPFLTDYEWYLIPLANPEGLDFTLAARDVPAAADATWRRNMSGARARPTLWKKNLDNEQRQDPESCFGTNINRNFAYHWQDAENMPAAPAPCSQQYPGVRPFSAAEARAVRHYVDGRAGSLRLAVLLGATFEADKESIRYPWHYSERRPSNWQRLQAVGEAAARDARLPAGQLFEVHQSSATGAVGGSLEDYLMGVVGTSLVYAVKPYHEPMPNTTHHRPVQEYVQKAINATLGLVRAWRAATQHDPTQQTLH